MNQMETPGPSCRLPRSRWRPSGPGWRSPWTRMDTPPDPDGDPLDPDRDLPDPGGDPPGPRQRLESCTPVSEFEFKNCVSPETTSHCHFDSGLGHHQNGDGQWPIYMATAEMAMGGGFQWNTVFKLKLKNSLVRITTETPQTQNPWTWGPGTETP